MRTNVQANSPDLPVYLFVRFGVPPQIYTKRRQAKSPDLPVYLFVRSGVLQAYAVSYMYEVYGKSVPYLCCVLDSLI